MPIDSALKIATDLLPVLEGSGNEGALCVARMLWQRLSYPQGYVTVAGETSAGKSTLVNALLGDALLPSGARPTNGTVVHVMCVKAASPRHLAILRDGTQAELGPSEFQEQCLRPMEELLRLQLRAPPGDGANLGLHVFDTPGFNSIVHEHREVLEEFLPNSDAVIFVAGYRQGVGQAEQDLLDIIGDATVGDPELPIALVVNRAPAGTTNENKRVREILSNATDCLSQQPILFIVETLPVEQPDPRMPDASAMWGYVAELMRSPARQAAVRHKLSACLQAILQETELEFERRILSASLSDEERQAVDTAMLSLAKALEDSHGAISRAEDDLLRLLPATVRQVVRQMRKRLDRDICDSSKWLGRQVCLEYLQGYLVPAETRAAARAIEAAILQRLDQLDRELAEIANTAIDKIVREVEISTGVAEKILTNIAATLAMKIAGKGVDALLRGLGGVGGAAAGAGNLAKMLLKRAGGLFGKTFGREVYAAIGRTFTKRAMQRMSIFLSVAIDTILYVRESKTWQAETSNQLGAQLEEWGADVMTELRENTLPSIVKANAEGVDGVYADLLDDVAARGELGPEQRRRLDEWKVLRDRTAGLQSRHRDLETAHVA